MYRAILPGNSVLIKLCSPLQPAIPEPQWIKTNCYLHSVSCTGSSLTLGSMMSFLEFLAWVDTGTPIMKLRELLTYPQTKTATFLQSSNFSIRLGTKGCRLWVKNIWLVIRFTFTPISTERSKQTAKGALTAHGMPGISQDSWEVLVLFPFYSTGNQSTDWLIAFCRDTYGVQARVWTRVSGPWFHTEKCMKEQLGRRRPRPNSTQHKSEGMEINWTFHAR